VLIMTIGVIAGLLIGFAGGWYARPTMDKDTIRVEAGPTQGINNPTEQDGFVVYEGQDGKYHWGMTSHMLDVVPPGTPPTDARYPKRLAVTPK